MLEAGGDGQLDLALDLKEFMRLEGTFTTKEAAEEVAFKNSGLFYSETQITGNPVDGFIVWYRN